MICIVPHQPISKHYTLQEHLDSILISNIKPCKTTRYLKSFTNEMRGFLQCMCESITKKAFCSSPSLRQLVGMQREI